MLIELVVDTYVYSWPLFELVVSYMLAMQSVLEELTGKILNTVKD